MTQAGAALARTDEQNVPVTEQYTPPATQIAALAYEYWLARGCPYGSPEEDWYRAENELIKGGASTK